MQTVIGNLDELNIPNKHLNFLKIFLNNIKGVESVQRVILFGSCARGDATENSDIDILVIGDQLTKEEEVFIMCDCPPEFGNAAYVNSDILIGSSTQYEKYKNEFGMVQKQIHKEGVDLFESV